MKKLSKYILSILMAINICATPIYAYDDNDSESNSIIVQVASPIVIPSVVVGGMILQSRKKKKQVQIQEYIDKLELIEQTDCSTGKIEMTTESASSSKKHKDSYAAAADQVQNLSSIKSAIQEALSMKEGKK